MAVLAVIAGCSSPESKLVGDWFGKTGSIEFYKDKTGVINPPRGTADLPANIKFKWDFVEKDRVRMDIAINGGKSTFAKFNGKDELIVEEDKFVKAK